VLERETETKLTTVGASRLFMWACNIGICASSFASGIVLGDTVLFHTKSGVLKAIKVSGYEEYEELLEEEDELGKRPERKRPGGKGVVQLNFPLVPAVPCNDTFLLSEVLGGVAIKWAGETSLGDYLVELSNCELVK
jgi:hypothetical protein